MTMNVRWFLLLVCVAVLWGQTPPPPKKPGVKTLGVQVDFAKLKPDAIFEIPGAPDWIAVDDSVWVSNYPKHTVTRIDPKANKIAETIALGEGKKPCSGMATGFGSLWVPNCGDRTLARIDLKTGKVTATLATGVADSEGGIATGASSVWLLTDAKGTLARIDPETNKVVAEIYVAPGSYAPAFGKGAAGWTSRKRNLVTRVDSQTNLIVETIITGKSPR